MTKKILSIGLIGMFIASLTACSSESNKTENKISEPKLKTPFCEGFDCEYCFISENLIYEQNNREAFISFLLQKTDEITSSTYYKMDSEHQIEKVKFLMSENVKNQIHPHWFHDLKLSEFLSDGQATLNYSNKILDSIQKNSK